MAEPTVHKYFVIERKTEDGLDLDGSPKQYDVQKCTASREEVGAALREVGTNYPELDDCMKVASAMLVGLDTIRSEARMQLSAVSRQILQGNAIEAATGIEAARLALGKWEDRHTLYVH